MSDGHRQRPLTVIAIGDIGETGKELRANASWITDMYTGRHDSGAFDALIFLGDNFYNTGLNIPVDEVEGKVKSILGKFSLPIEGLGRENIHAVAGNHDWYARNAVDVSLLFGLIDIEEGPLGLTDRGNRRSHALNEWSYYYHLPALVTYPLSPHSGDSAAFLFVDSALPLRTPVATWSQALDSLRALLRRAESFRWRILAMHHPFYSIGEHGGYTEWNDETGHVEYLTGCDKDSNAAGWLKNWLDPEDLCAPKYRQFMDSLRIAIAGSGVKVHAVLSGHDHSLQVLSYPGKDEEQVPAVHIISGAGSKVSVVRESAPPFEYSAQRTDPSKKGRSRSGFARIQLSSDGIRIIFFDSESGDPIDMGEGRTGFIIRPDGSLE